MEPDSQLPPGRVDLIERTSVRAMLGYRSRNLGQTVLGNRDHGLMIKRKINGGMIKLNCPRINRINDRTNLPKRPREGAGI